VDYLYREILSAFNFMPSAQKYAASIFQAWQVVGTEAQGQKQSENETEWNDKSCASVCARQAIKWRAGAKFLRAKKRATTRVAAMFMCHIKLARPCRIVG